MNTKHTTTLEDVSERFNQWRKNRVKRERIPSELWRAATQLTRSYPTTHICKKLKLNNEALRRQMESLSKGGQRKKNQQVSFVEVDLGIKRRDGSFFGTSPLIEIEKKDGSKLKIYPADGIAIDLSNITQSFVSVRASKRRRKG